ncbi:hypothetical protein BIV57_14425 [Mangrovactinospora gilvigrisea]|uniref:Glycoside hydrolase n=1 Tax=Mangrovactinospora gilvigrisea TaxID=1428644 RepID=A0A1J7BTL2_9ACTN|nr:hypothetical protein [Mangrovactinospora gilvigrisea]OIV36793.1 hypothetical protein BIV57_14425 [Mangrovactinospora gilvigrisea]
MTTAHPDLHRRFADPQPAFSPVPLWWWSGAYEDGVTPERLGRQLSELARQGVRNAVVMNLAPTGPLYGSLADRPHFLTEEWWELFDGACAAAEPLGVRLWFYDQIGFSGANLQGLLVAGTPEWAGHSLARATVEATGAEVAAGRARPALPAEGTPVCLTAAELDAPGGNPVGAPVGEDGFAGLDADALHRVTLVYEVREGFDYFSADGCAKLLDTVHGAIERRLGKWFGSVIVGSFQDELPSLPSWGAGFADAFRERCGYDPLPLLPALWEGGAGWGSGPAAERLRGDYHRLRAALAEESFFRPLHDWHERHGLLVGFDQQGPARSGEPSGAAQLYGDYLRTHRWYSAPGTDHHGSTKIHSSLAHHYRRPRSWIEAFHSSGWGGTLEETFDWLLPWLARGANLYDPHAVYYDVRGGWYEWAPPSTCWRQPYWRHYRYFADTVSRLCGILTEGHHECSVAVLYPSATAQAGTLLTTGEEGATPLARAAHAAYFALIGDEEWHHAVPGALPRLGVDFDVLDDDSAAGARVVGTGAAARLATAEESYRTVLVPGCAVVEGATALRLLQFAQAGGRVVLLGALPERSAAGPKRARARSASVEGRWRETGGNFEQAGEAAIEQLRALVADPAAEGVRHLPYDPDDPEAAPHLDEALGALLDGADRPVDAPVPTLVRRVGRRRVVFVPAADDGSATAQPMVDGPVRADGHQWTHQKTNTRQVNSVGYDFDPARNRERMTVRLPGHAASVEQWDPVTGGTRPAVTRAADGWTEVDVDFASAPAAVLVALDGGPDAAAAPAGPAAPVAEAATETPLADTWTTRLLPTALASPSGTGRTAEGEGTEARPGGSGGSPADGPAVLARAVPRAPAGRTARATHDGMSGDWDFATPDEPPSDAVVEAWRIEQATAEQGPYRRVLTGIGTRAWWFGPADPAALPDPLTPAQTSAPGLAARLRAPGAKAVRYDLARGLEKDPVHRGTLGPSGTVPEEFWHVGGVRAGQAVHLRTTLPAVAGPAGPLHLAVGAPGRKDVWWNGRKLPEDPGGYLRLDPVETAPTGGRNVLEVRVTAEQAGTLRGHWCLTRDAGAFRRPEWVTPSTPVRRASAVRIATVLQLDAEPAAATVQFGTIGPCALRVNGHEVGRQGAFDPYPERPHHRVVPYEVGDRLHAGANTVEAVFTDPGTFPVALLVDGIVRMPDGSTATLVTDTSWEVTRDGAAEPAALRRAQHGDPRFSHLTARPHPLPRTAWLEARPDQQTVLDLEPDPFPDQEPADRWFRIAVPPGAHAAELPEPLASLPGVQAWLDGRELAVTADGVALPDAAEPGRVLVLRARSAGDGLWSGPARFRCGAGAMAAGPWAEHGLGSFAGGVRYSRRIEAPADAGRVELDLGRVRGTAEVAVDGRPAGVRVWSPYRFDLTGLVAPGGSELTVTVLGTLAPWLDDASPTPYVLPGQRTAGLLGPVRLLTTRQA